MKISSTKRYESLRERMGNGDMDRRSFMALLGYAGIAAASSRQNHARQHGCHHRDAHAFLLLQVAGKMALRQVRELVGHDRCKLGLGIGVKKQSAVDADHPAGGGEGIELRAVDKDECQSPVLQLTGFRDAVDVVFDE